MNAEGPQRAAEGLECLAEPTSPAETHILQSSLPTSIEAADSPERRRQCSPPILATSPPLSIDDDIQTIAESPQEIDAVSISSTDSIPNAFGVKSLGSGDNVTKVVYEAYEIVSSANNMHRNSWKTLCGIKFGIKWTTYKNGFVELHPVKSYEQGELADLHGTETDEYEAEHAKKEGKSYTQDLANRAFKLDIDVYDTIQRLLSDKTRATNNHPYHRREWRLVVLKEGEFQMTELLPERKRKFLRRKRPDPLVQRHFLVLRGEEVKSTKEVGGWRGFNRHTNPWWKFDQGNTKEARQLNKRFLDKCDEEDRRRARRRFPPPPPPPRMSGAARG
ncbi:hypothetical protein F5Y15DRAFT_137596 [Xylariaceae sp. FL0016]|nr:hypothetical protein F5Y15DRAFT_137596 [Xylariaceae sp. FL0016]